MYIYPKSLLCNHVQITKTSISGLHCCIPPNFCTNLGPGGSCYAGRFVVIFGNLKRALLSYDVLLN